MFVGTQFNFCNLRHVNKVHSHVKMKGKDRQLGTCTLSVKTTMHYSHCFISSQQLMGSKVSYLC